MVVVVANTEGKHIRELKDFTLEVSFGDDENTVSLECEPELCPHAGEYIFVDNTEYGGTIDEQCAETSTSGTKTMTCTGRSWHGMLANKRIMPPDGATHLEVEGSISSVLYDVLGRIGLSSFFVPEKNDATIKYTFERFCDAYTGICDMLNQAGRKLKLVYSDEIGKVKVSAPEIVDYTDKINSDMMDFSITKTSRCTNHLVCAGTGEGEERIVTHFYADANGEVSHDQTFYGVDEITSFYDYTSADAERLEEEGKKKLEEMQTTGEIESSTHDDIDVDVGDIITALDAETNLEVSAQVTKKVMKHENGACVYDYEVGQATTRQTTASAIAESSKGEKWTEGTAIHITSSTINVRVVDPTSVKGWF